MLPPIQEDTATTHHTAPVPLVWNYYHTEIKEGFVSKVQF